MLYLHRERVSKLTALHSALPDCINLYLCAFNLVKTGLVSSWSYAVVGKRGCLEDCSQAALAPWAVEGWLPSISSCLPPGQRWDVPLCDHPHSLSSPSALFHGSRCSLCSLWAESLKPSEKKKSYLAYPGSSSPPEDTCHQHRWRYLVWHGSFWWWGKQQGKHLACLAR